MFLRDLDLVTGDRSGIPFFKCAAGHRYRSRLSAQVGNLTGRCAEVDGATLVAARRRKERTYPELVGDCGHAKLVVLAGEIGERFSEETHS